MPRPGSLSLSLCVLVAAGCMPQFRVMDRATDAAFPGARGSARDYWAAQTQWTRTESLGVRSEAVVTMLDPALGADLLAFEAHQAGREVSDRYDRDVWNGLYGERGDRLPFDVSWSFDRLFQPQRVTNPQVGWTFTLMDDHGRRWSPLFVDDVETSENPDRWTGHFRVWFPAKDVLKGPLFDGQTRKVTLRIAGAPGAADFVWKFRPELGAPPER